MANLGKYNPQEFETKIYNNWMEKKYFKSVIDKSKKPYTIIMPPPNITSVLHIGHAFQQTIQDIIIRQKRMQGYNALWLPGSDHAAIATEAKVVQKLKAKGINKLDLGREKFLQEIHNWYAEYKSAIIEQFKRMGFSCDWDRLAFTMDEKNCKAVREAFVRLYKKGWIYKGKRIVNWCPGCNTSISDAEVEYEANSTHLWHISYLTEDKKSKIIVATTRPETILGDTAVAVNPKDKRYEKMVGKKVILPIVNKLIPIIADEYVDMEFGTGVVKITPAHDINDFEVGARHNLPLVEVIGKDGKLNANAGKFEGLDIKTAREEIVKELQNLGRLEKIENYNNNVAHCERCHGTIESLASEQWFVKMSELAKPAIEVVENGSVKFVDEQFKRSYLHWMKNIKDWCISRQLWSGHRVPIFYCQDCGEIIVEKEDPTICPKCKSKKLVQDTDTLDTWFSSALWPLSTLGWPENTPDLDYYYPTDTLVTGREIINLWVARMIFSGLEYKKDIPFRNVLINGTVCDIKGRKMSKSLGNGIDPIVMIERYSVDALRHSLINGGAIETDCKFSEKKVELSAAFLNKLWNTANFVFINQENETLLPLKQVKLDSVDKWILTKLNDTIKTVNRNFDNYELNVALTNIDNFVLNDFCDYYVELSKPILYKGGDLKTNKISAMSYVYLNILKLLHPFVPMITEKLYLSLNFVEKIESIMIDKFPEYNKIYEFKKELNEIESVIEVIKDIRNLRKSQNIADNKAIKINISTSSKILTELKDEIKKLCLISELTFDNNIDKSNSVCKINKIAEIYLIFDARVVEEEIAKFEAELKRLEFEIERSSKMLANENFVKKAPAKLIEAEQQKLSNNKEVKNNIEQKLKELKK